MIGLRRSLHLLSVAFGLVVASGAAADDLIESEQASFRVETVAQGLEFPWSLAFLPGGDMLITERGGQLRHFKDGRINNAEVLGLEGLNIYVSQQSGLHDVVLHPNFKENQFIYLAYATGNDAANHIEIARGQWTGDALSDVQVIFGAEPERPGGLHPGGRLLFLNDGTLLLTVGDAFHKKDDAQLPSSHLGAVLRLTDDGQAPEDNPLTNTPGAKPEIFTTGHRNIQGLTLRPGTDEVWAHEHGARGGDEVNQLVPGANYGWPIATYGIHYDGSIISDKRTVEGTEQPIWYWVPSIAPSGLAFYDGDKFPEWRGDLFVGALAHQKLVRLEMHEGHVISDEDLLDDRGERIRDVRLGPDGLIYLLTDGADGKLLRLSPQ